MFLIKQVSSDLGITPQAIYKQKEELQNKGYMIKNSSNDWEITSDGYNYLKEKQINRFKRNNISLKENDIKSTNLQGKEENNSLNETLINFYETRLEEIKQSYENQLNEQKKQVEYFKNLYEEEKSERIRANAQYQTYLLGTAEDNKRHWWQFWNKTNKERDILKIAVVERYGGNSIANGFISGFNLSNGAIASSISHDSHNIIVIGIVQKEKDIQVNHF